LCDVICVKSLRGNTMKVSAEVTIGNGTYDDWLEFLKAMNLSAINLLLMK